MKIVDVKALCLRYQMEKPITGGRGQFSFRDGLIIKIIADNGMEGFGEANVWGNMSLVAYVVSEVLKPLLIGQDPARIEYLWEKMYRCTSTFGRRGLIITAMSGVDIALWDLVAKFRKMAVYELMGGVFHNEVKAYASGLHPADPKEMIKEAQDYLRQGFTAMKQRLGVDPAMDVELVRIVREAVGNETELMADACTSWNPITAEDWTHRENLMRSSPASTSALRIARQLEEYHLAFIEEPLPPDDLEGMAQLASQIDTPIAIGENVFTRYEFRDVIRMRAADVLQPDVTRTGGLTEARKICAMASASHLPCIPHIYGTGVALAANLHLITATPNALYAEYDTLANPLRHELIGGALKPVKGFLRCPDGPGLGFQINEQVLNRYLVEAK
jgi:L-alanine-DL-glutamate epimerase-like enolase superfamily enzyme